MTATTPNDPSNQSSGGDGAAIRAVLFDFGGVVLTSPFEAFNRYEAEHGLPTDIIRTINATNPDDNAWAKFERRAVDVAEFASLFEQEAAALGHTINGSVVLELINGEVRPEMVEAVRRVKDAGYITACLTNNFRPWGDGRSEEDERGIGSVLAMFDEVVESSKIGVRKPEQGFYDQAIALLQIDANEAVFLDDLGINLKPAKAMGMTTIKVLSADQALTDLEAVLGIALR